jgi:hypothetical protein
MKSIEKFLELLDLADLTIEELAKQCLLRNDNAKRKFLKVKNRGGNTFQKDLEIILHLLAQANKKGEDLNEVIQRLA